MGGRKSKKKGSRGAANQPGFKDILLKFQQEDYAGAARLFRKARITSEDAGKAKQLKAAILHQIAFQNFLDKEYAKAIEVLEPNLLVQSKAGFPLPLELTHMLMGLSYLYLGRFDEAVATLQKAAQPTDSFASFYYLLTLIYASHKNQPDSSYEAFLQEHKEMVTTLEKGRKQYLKVAWYLVQEDFANANSLLDKLVAKNKVQKLNTSLLCSLLQQKPFLNEVDGTNAKTLYKVLAGMPPTEKEKPYLDHFEEFEEYLFVAEENDQYDKVSQQLSDMCNEGIPLADEIFQQCFDGTRDDLKSYLVYNQIANLYNSFEEANMDRILRILRKHVDLFLQVPESGILYLEIADLNHKKIRPNAFWKAVLDFMDRFGNTLSAKQFDELGWKIQICCIGPFVDLKKEDGIVALCTKYPNLVGPKFHLLLEDSLPGIMRFPKEIKDVFSLENITDNKEVLIQRFDDFLENIYPSSNSFPSFLSDDDEEEEVEMCLDIHHGLQDKILEWVTLHPKIADERILLDLYKSISASLRELVEDYGDLMDRKTIVELDEKIKKMLKLLHLEGKDVSTKEIESALLDNDQRGELKEAFDSLVVSVKTKTLFQKYIQAGDAELLIARFMKEIDIRHYDEELIPKLTLFFKLLVEEIPGSAEAILDDFNERYQSQARREGCEHPHEFYCKWLSHLFKNTKNKTYHPYVYNVLIGYHLRLISDIEPINYNTASKALTFMENAINASLNFEYDLDVAARLVAYLKMAIKRRKLKTLAVTLKKTEAFFNALDE